MQDDKNDKYAYHPYAEYAEMPQQPPNLQPQDPTQRILYNNPAAQGAYDKCAEEVVALAKCVKDKGPTWFWSCNEANLALQRCYNQHLHPQDSSKSIDIMGSLLETKKEVVANWERLKRFVKEQYS